LEVKQELFSERISVVFQRLTAVQWNYTSIYAEN